LNGAATQIWAPAFERDFEALPPSSKTRIQAKIDDIGRRLRSFPHFRMEGGLERYRLRVGDYRIIYRFDAQRGEMELIAVGHRSKIYR
jgi:mRNA interferase RelE/StbE